MTQNQGEGAKVLAGKRISRGDFLKAGSAGVAGAVVLGATGCGGGGGGSGSSGGKNQFVLSFGPDDSGTLKTLVSKFNKQNKGKYKVKWRQMQADTGQYFDQLRTQFQAQSGDIDLIGGDVIWPAQFAANGWIIDLSDRFPESERKKFLDGPIQSNTYNGKIYGVPWYTDAGMLYYRKDLLQKSGFNSPPKTWDELKSMAKKVKQDSGTKFGFVFQGAQYEGGVVDGVEYIASNSGSVLAPGDSKKVTIDSANSVDGLKIEHSMVADGVSPKAVSTYTEQETQTAFLNGDAIFARNWPYMYALISGSKIKPDQVSVAPLPAGSGSGGKSVAGLGGWNFYISAFSQKQDAAYAFVKFATAPEQQKFRALKGSFLPTLKSLYKDKEIINNIPVIKLAPEALSNQVPRPISPYYSDMSLKMQEQFNASVKGATTPQKAANTLQSELKQIIKQGSGA
ncbi:MAG: ABC transporter substrate-binding protein [Rubrobacteraceae bacterium]